MAEVDISHKVSELYLCHDPLNHWTTEATD